MPGYAGLNPAGVACATAPGKSLDLVSGRFLTRVGTASASDSLGALFENDRDYLLVAKFSMDGNGQYGIIDLFIDPTSLVEPGAPTLSSTSTAPSLTQLSRFNIRVNSLETDDRFFFDNLRISDSFEGAIRALAVDVPEPASLSLLAVAGMALLRRRRGNA